MRALALVLLCAAVGHADVLPHAGVAAINTEVNAVFTRITTAEDAFLIANPRELYVQVLADTTIRADGTTARTIDDTQTRPSDRTVDWSDLGFTALETFVCEYEVDEYRGTLGKGYVMRARVGISGVPWIREKHVGPEALVIVDGDTEWHVEETE